MNFDIDKGTTSYSAKNPKSDNEQKAYVTITSHNLISGDSVRYVVAKPTTSTEVSNATTYTGVNYPNKKTFDYNSGENAKKGNNYRLKVKSNNYWVWLKGQWNS